MMDLLPQLGSAAAVIGLSAVCLWWLRRRGLAAVWRPRRAGLRRLQTIERLPLGPQHTLHLIRVGERALIVGCSPGGVTLLAERPWQEIAAPDGALRGAACGG